MDPFSILVGSVGFLDVCFRVINAIRDIYGSADKVDEEIVALSTDIKALLSIHRTLNDFYDANVNVTRDPVVADADRIRVDNLWEQVTITLRNCKFIVSKLEGLLNAAIGKDGNEAGPSKLDRIRRQLRKRSKDSDFYQHRQRLSNAQGSLQMLFIALNLEYTRASHDSTDKSMDQISEKVEAVRQLGFRLQSQLSLLRPKIDHANDEILRNSIKSVTKVASSVHLNRYFHIPNAVSSIFTGRQELLEELRDAYDVSSASGKTHLQKRFVVQGLSGSGKTQFCCKFAQDNRQKFWGIFWIDASSDENAKQTFSSIAKAGGVDSNIRAAKNWMSSLEYPWLLLIDNADDPKISVEDYFPEGEMGLILVTTRVPTNRRHGTIGKRYYQFENLKPDEANELLLRAADASCPWDASAKEAATVITRALGCLPLALVHAGTAIANNLCELENYMNFYRRSWDRIRQAWKDSGHFQDHGDDDNMNVYSSYEILYQKLEKTMTQASQDAAELLKIFSFLNRENIRFDLLTAAAKNPWAEKELRERGERKSKELDTYSKPKPWIQRLRHVFFVAQQVIFMDRTPPVLPRILRDIESSSLAEDIDFRFRAALSLLTQYSLISYHEEANSYYIHPLVHDWVRERPQMRTGERAIWCQAAATTLAQAIILSPSGSTNENVALQKDLLPHVIELRSCQLEIRNEIVKNRRPRKRPWPVCEPIFGTRQAIESAKFSLVYTCGGLWNEAEGLQVAVKNYLCERLGLEHQLTIAAMLLLSHTYLRQGRQNKAAALRRQAFQSCMNSFGADHPKTLKAMDYLAESCRLQSRWKEARQLSEKAIARMTNILGADHEDTLIAVDNLGEIMARYWDWEKAKDLHEKAMSRMQHVLGPTDLRTLSAMEHVAKTYLELGGDLLERAQEIQTQVLEERRKQLGKEQPFTLLATANLARIKAALGQTNEAEDLLRTALRIAGRNLGENHNGTIMGKIWLAQVLLAKKRYREAEEILTQVVQRQKYESSARDDGEHADRIFALWVLLQCYQLDGKVDDAIRIGTDLSEAVNTIGGEGLGKQHKFAELLAKKQEELAAAQRTSVAEPLETVATNVTVDA